LLALEIFTGLSNTRFLGSELLHSGLIKSDYPAGLKPKAGTWLASKKCAMWTTECYISLSLSRHKVTVQKLKQILSIKATQTGQITVNDHPNKPRTQPPSLGGEANSTKGRRGFPGHFPFTASGLASKHEVLKPGYFPACVIRVWVSADERYHFIKIIITIITNETSYRAR
jgi:hypothetical protein